MATETLTLEEKAKAILGDLDIRRNLSPEEDSQVWFYVNGENGMRPTHFADGFESEVEKLVEKATNPTFRTRFTRLLREATGNN